MKNDEAKFILNGYRPNGSDGPDAMFGEALRQVQSDPALGAWFERSRAHDTAVAGKLAQIAPPAGLREAILAGGRVSGGKPTARGGIWRQPVWLAAAAAVAVLLVSAAALWPRPALADEPLVKFVMRDALDEGSHGGSGSETKALAAELGAAGARLGQSVPVDFAALAKTGCRAVDVQGRAVLEVCFTRDGKTWFHCYIAKCTDFPALAAKQGPQFASAGRISAVTWADGEHRFVVAGAAGRDAVAQLL